MLKSVLVANRGEIACRIFRTARRMGLRTIAVYSEADSDSAHVRMADQAVEIGPAPAAESYLVIDALIAAALATGAEAIHPGYGFLSEQADFAEAVQAAGLVWIGPPASAIRAMGRKDAAKQLMQAAGVPVTPGYQGDDQSPAGLQAQADALGYPVLIKAVAGGGGKGMRRVDRAEDFAPALAACQRESAAAFGDSRVLLEIYVARPRHIEVQVFGDQAGQVVHLFERDCSLQRRHQKVIEEAPAPGMTAETRAALTAAAVQAAQAVGYVGAGTVEFIADASEGLRADRIWFMEMNTRLQVEHPVTEAVTGVDLVEWQFRIASGEALPLAQSEIHLNGHAIEARLYAEDPAAGFLPSIGQLEHFRLPSGLRIDSAVEAGDEVSPHYDPMIAKLIAHASTREGASDQLAEACAGVEVWPVRTNAAFLARCLDHPDFIAGELDTAFIADRFEDLALPLPPSAETLSLAAGAILARDRDHRASPWRDATGFRLNASPETRLRLFLGGEPILATLPDEEIEADVLVTDDAVVIFEAGQAFAFSAVPPQSGFEAAGLGDGQILAPMPGRIVAVGVSEGDRVSPGHVLVTLEAMKMEYALSAPFEGQVESVRVKVGDQVSEGTTLVQLKAAD